MATDGDCFTTAVEVANLLVEGGEKDVYIVHGIPLGQAGDAEGLRYWHAWVEVGVAVTFPNVEHEFTFLNVIDRSNGHDLEIPKAIYYKVGNIDQTWRFSVDEAREEMINRGHYGPWVDHWEELTEG